MDDVERRRNRLRAMAGIALAALAAVAWSVATTLNNDDLTHVAHSGAYVLGAVVREATIATAVLWPLVYFACIRKRVPGFGWLAALIPFLSVVLANDAGLPLIRPYADIAQPDDNVEMRIATAEIDKATTAMRIGGEIDMRVRAKGQAGEMERLGKNYLKSGFDVERDYQRGLRALDYPAFLTHERMAADRGLVATSAKLAKARALAKTSRERMAAAEKAGRDAILHSSLDATNKRDMLKGFDEADALDGRRSERDSDARDGVFAELEAAVDILAHPKGRWVFRGGKFVFGDRRDLEAFTGHWNKAREFDARRMAMERAMRNDQAGSLLDTAK